MNYTMLFRKYVFSHELRINEQETSKKFLVLFSAKPEASRDFRRVVYEHVTQLSYGK